MKTRAILAFAALLSLVQPVTSAEAAERQVRPLATTSSSPVTGISFSEPANSLPIDTRFSQSIQTVAFDLNLTCGQIEAYGWPMGPNDQARVDALFTNTAVELNKLGYRVTPQDPASTAEDITVYTAARPDDARAQKLFVWSAGDAGLLLLVCDAKGEAPAPASMGTLGGNGGAPESSGFGGFQEQPADVDPAKLVGVWEGTYTCRSQGQTGGKLTISKVKAGGSADEHAVEGMLDFFPTLKNPNVDRGSYKLSGTFNSVTQQAYFEPGKWLKQPKGYIAKPIIAYFDVTRGDVSAIFQDTTGCTSFEAHMVPGSADEAKKTAAPVKKKVKKKPKPKPAPVVEPSYVEPSADEILPQEPITNSVPETTGDNSLAPMNDTPVTVPDAPAETTTTTTTTTTVTEPAPSLQPQAAPGASETPKAAEPAPKAEAPKAEAPKTTETTVSTTTTTTTAPAAPVAPAAAPAAAPAQAPSASFSGGGKPVIDIDPTKTEPATAPAAAPAAPSAPAIETPPTVPTGPIVVPNKGDGTAGDAAGANDALAKAKAALEASEAQRKAADLAVPPASEPKAEQPAQ